MKAAVLRQPDAPLSIEEVVLPAPGRGQVQVRIRASGVCHTQLSEAKGRRGEDRHLPHLLGHEAAGVVEAVGPEVSRVRPGDPVVVTWIKGPGLSVAGPRCTDARGLPVNAGPVATFAEQAVVSEDRVTAVPREMPLDLAALLGCAVATGAGAVLNTAALRPGESVAVFGAGGVGLNAVQGARLGGAGRIIAVDVHEAKLALARGFGATHTVDARREDAVEAIRALTEGKGVHVAVESAGRRAAMEAAFASVRFDGGRAVLAGNLPAGETIAVDPLELIRGKRLLGCWGGDTRPERDIPRYAGLFLEGKLKLAELVSHRCALEQVNEVLAALDRGEVARALLVF